MIITKKSKEEIDDTYHMYEYIYDAYSYKRQEEGVDWSDLGLNGHSRSFEYGETEPWQIAAAMDTLEHYITGRIFEEIRKLLPRSMFAGIRSDWISYTPTNNLRNNAYNVKSNSGFKGAARPRPSKSTGKRKSGPRQNNMNKRIVIYIDDNIAPYAKKIDAGQQYITNRYWDRIQQEIISKIEVAIKEIEKYYSGGGE